MWHAQHKKFWKVTYLKKNAEAQGYSYMFKDYTGKIFLNCILANKKVVKMIFFKFNLNFTIFLSIDAPYLNTCLKHLVRWDKLLCFLLPNSRLNLIKTIYWQIWWLYIRVVVCSVGWLFVTVMSHHGHVTVDDGWWLIDDWWWMMDDGWWMMDDERCMMDDWM